MGIISGVEDSILAVVNATLPGVLNATGPLPGVWSLELLKLLLQKAPGVYVSFNGGELVMSNNCLLNARFDVYVVTLGANAVTRLRGAGNIIGAYTIIEALIPALNAYTIAGAGSLRGKSVTNLFSAGAGSLRGKSVNNLFSNVLLESGGAVYGMQFELPRLPLDAVLDSAALANFLILNIDSSLTTPGADDFTTTITLP